VLEDVHYEDRGLPDRVPHVVLVDPLVEQAAAFPSFETGSRAPFIPKSFAT